MVSSFFSRMKDAVRSTKDNLVGKIEDLVLGRKVIDEDLLEQLEAILIGADIGVGTTAEILERIRQQTSRGNLGDLGLLSGMIKAALQEILSAPSQQRLPTPPVRPQVIFVVGVNGVGKTTTIGKLAHRLSQDGKKVVVCASDTFRAAAIEQLEIWAQRSGARIIKKEHGADPSAVLYESLDKAKAIDADAVIVDTAGRLHTKVNLMKQLEKMVTTAQKKVAGAPHEVLLVIDATTGQNGLVQAREFLRTCGVTALIVTKLDGTAKGGVVVAIVRELKLPIAYVGIGEKVDDLITFNAEDFVESIFTRR